jgi:hypothetical protein
VVQLEASQAPNDDKAGGCVAARLEGRFAEMYPKGFEGTRVIFKWDKGQLWFAFIPIGPRNLTVH